MKRFLAFLLPTLCALLPLAASARPALAQNPSSLSVERAGQRHVWWRSDAAPDYWTAPDSVLLGGVRWTSVRPGLWLGELDLLVNRGLLRLRIIVVRVTPGRYDVALQQRTSRGRAAWSVDSAPAGAALALNAGQFTEAAPWGWLVLDSRLAQLAGHGPLSAALGVDSTGIRWIDAADLEEVQHERRWSAGFQSYPVLLRGGRIPDALRDPDGGVDLDHRDSRLAFGLQGDTIIIALTRYTGAGRLLERLPAGLTTPETAALMGALGARDALMLDGGLSAQLLVREADGRTHSWRGLRSVPLGLVFTERIR